MSLGAVNAPGGVPWEKFASRMIKAVMDSTTLDESLEEIAKGVSVIAKKDIGKLLAQRKPANEDSKAVVAIEVKPLTDFQVDQAKHAFKLLELSQDQIDSIPQKPIYNTGNAYHEQAIRRLEPLKFGQKGFAFAASQAISTLKDKYSSQAGRDQSLFADLIQLMNPQALVKAIGDDSFVRIINAFAIDRWHRDPDAVKDLLDISKLIISKLPDGGLKEILDRIG